MSKSKPKTIADLKINWTFDWNIDTGISDLIQKLNPDSYQLKIVKRKYSFIIDDFSFDIDGEFNIFSSLFTEIDYQVFKLQNRHLLPKVLVLDHFELISKNKFLIHVKENS